MPEEEGAESTEFVPPVTFSEDGKTATWNKGDEKVEFPTEQLSERLNKAVLADKQGQQLGEARKRLSAFESRYGDIDKQLADAEDPDAVLDRIRQVVEGKPAATDTSSGDDDWLKGLMSEEKPKGPTLEEVEARLEKKFDQKLRDTLASREINEEIDNAISKLGIPNKKLPDGSMLYDFIADATLKAGANNQTPYPELVKSVAEVMGEAWAERDKAQAAAEAERIKQQGATVDQFGRPIDLSSKREKVDFENPESVDKWAKRVAARFEAEQ